MTQWKLKKKKKKPLPNRNAHDEVIRQVKNELHFIPKKIEIKYRISIAKHANTQSAVLLTDKTSSSVMSVLNLPPASLGMFSALVRGGILKSKENDKLHTTPAIAYNWVHKRIRLSTADLG